MPNASDDERLLKAPENKGILDLETRLANFLIAIAYAPLRLCVFLLSKIIQVLRPYAPQIIPLVVCVSLIPIVVFLSISAGWILWRSVPSEWETPLFLQYGDGVAPYANATLRQIAPQQPYDVSLHLVIPAITSNLALGNFMATVIISAQSDEPLAVVRRSGIVLPPRQRLSIFGSQLPVVNIDMPVLESFVAGTTHATIFVELGRRDNWKSIGNGEGRELTVTSASLHGTVRHYGIRGLVTRFPLTSAFTSSFVFLAISLLFLGVCIFPMMLSGPPYRITPEEEMPDFPPPKHPSEYGSDTDEGAPRRRRRSRSIKSIEVKSESLDTSIPVAESTEVPLRRRRSRIIKDLSDSDS